MDSTGVRLILDCSGLMKKQFKMWTGFTLVFNQTGLKSFQANFTLLFHQIRLVSHWFLPGWSAAGWPAGAPGCVGSVPVRCWDVLVWAGGHTRPGQCTAAESPLRTTTPVSTSQTSSSCVSYWERGSHRAGSAGRWCAGPEPPSAAPSRPSSLSPGCSSCRRRSRPAPADREQGTVNPQGLLTAEISVWWWWWWWWRYLTSLSEDFTGINDEGQRLHLKRFVDGRHFVLQVDGKVLHERPDSETALTYRPWRQRVIKTAGRHLSLNLLRY